MIRPLIVAALATAALAAGSAARAQTAVLYGLLDASGAHVKPVGGVSHWHLDNGDLQRTFIGFRGAEDLGGGLRAVFKLESYVRLDTGTVGRSDGDGFFSRERAGG